MSNNPKIGFRGMKPSGNELTHPPGSLLDAVNVVLTEKDVIELRRGQIRTTFFDNDISDAAQNIARELYQWGEHLFVHFNSSATGLGFKLALWKDWLTAPVYSLVGNLTEPDKDVCRMKFAELSRSVFFTTSEGLYVLDSPVGTARKAGLSEPILAAGQGTAASASGTWLGTNKAVAGRVVVGKKDANGRIILSAPSNRWLHVNPADISVPVGQMSRSGSTVTVTLGAHKYRALTDTVTISPGEANFPAGTYPVNSVTATTITYGQAGAATSSTVIQTVSTGTSSPSWEIWLPPGLSAGDFVRIYRTDETDSADIDPGDECFLASETILTASNISSGFMTISDNTPSSFLSEPLSINPNTGDGAALGRNDRPPLMRDVCRWDGRLWGLETTDRHRLRLRLIGTGSPNGLQSGDLVAVNCRVYEAVPGGVTGFPLYTEYTPTENVDLTSWTMSGWIAEPHGDTGLRAFQRHDGQTGLGYVLLEQVDPVSALEDSDSGDIGAIYAATDRPSAFGDEMPPLKEITAAARVSDVVTCDCVAHGFAVGQQVMLAFNANGGVDADYPPGLKTVATVPDVDHFTYEETGPDGSLASAPYYAYATTFVSDNNRQLLRYSKPGEPEAWPLPFYPDGFPEGAEGLRVTPLPSGDGIVVALKNNGFWRVSGNYPYRVEPLDETADLVAPDTLKKHNGTLHALTSQGVCQINESGVGKVGQDVASVTRGIIARLREGVLRMSLPFAISYESEGQYLLGLPEVATPGQYNSWVSQQLVYHSEFGVFTRWTGRRTCGLVWRGADTLVYGDGARNRIRQEFKSLRGEGDGVSANDFYEDLFFASGTVSTVDSDTSRFTGSNLETVVVGDAFVTGGTYRRVTAIGSGYFDFQPPASNGAATGNVFLGYDVSLTWPADANGAPGIESRWRQLQLHFKERLVDRLSLTFQGEKAANTETVVVRGQPSDEDFTFFDAVSHVSTLRAKVPDSFERVAMQTVTLSFHEALGFFRLLGLSGSAKPVTERTGQ